MTRLSFYGLESLIFLTVLTLAAAFLPLPFYSLPLALGYLSLIPLPAYLLLKAGDSPTFWKLTACFVVAGSGLFAGDDYSQAGLAYACLFFMFLGIDTLSDLKIRKDVAIIVFVLACFYAGMSKIYGPIIPSGEAVFAKSLANFLFVALVFMASKPIFVNPHAPSAEKKHHIVERKKVA